MSDTTLPLAAQMKAAVEAKDFGTAHGLLTRLRQTDPNTLEILLLEGKFFFDQNQFREALGVWNRAFHLHPSSNLILYNRAITLWALGAQDEAINDLTDASKFAADEFRAEALAQLTQMLFAAGREAEAGRCLEDLVALMPENPKLRFDLALHYTKFKKLAHAEHLLAALCAEHPDTKDFAVLYVQVLKRMGKNEKALAFAESSLGGLITREHESFYIQLLTDAGKYQPAHDLLVKRYQSDTSNIDTIARIIDVTRTAPLPGVEQWEDKLEALHAAQPRMIGYYLKHLHSKGRFEDLFNSTTKYFNLMPWDELIDVATQTYGETSATWTPPFEGHVDPADRTVLFAACDEVYYEKYAQRFVKSALAHAPHCVPHLHVIRTREDSSPEDFKVPNGAILTTEYMHKPSTTLMACRRFMLLPDLLQLHHQPVICLDVDVYISKDPSECINTLRQSDVGLYQRFRDLVINQQIHAGFVFANPTRRAEQFFQIVGAYCSYFLTQGTERPYLDQIALFACFVVSGHLASGIRIGRVPENALNWQDFSSDSYVLAPKGDDKQALEAIIEERG